MEEVPAPVLAIHLVLVARAEVLLVLLHRLLAKVVVDLSATRPAEEELAEVQPVVEVVIAVVPKILQEALSQIRLARLLRNRLLRISLDMVSIVL